MRINQARRMERETRERLAELMADSEAHYGESFVRFSPLWRDYLSRRRRRLSRQYWALKRGHYVKG